MVGKITSLMCSWSHMPRTATKRPATMPSTQIDLAVAEARTFAQILAVLPNLRQYVRELKRAKRRSRP